MAYDVKTKFKSFLPGAGRDSSGNPKQGKTRVVGQIDVTSYAGAEGEPLNAVDVGLAVIDNFDFKVQDGIGGAAPGVLREVAYARSTGHFYLLDVSEGSVASATTGGTETILFTVEGDSAEDVELT